MALNNKSYESKFDIIIRHLAEKSQNEAAIFYLDKHSIEIDTAQIIESISYIVENKFVGSAPKNGLIEFRNKLEREKDDNT